MTAHQDQANAIKKADQMLSLADLEPGHDTLAEQIRETVVQENIGITVRMATITCTCGKRRALVLMYKCLYCGVWFCTQCAEAHFGKTIEQYKKDKAA